MSNLTLKEKSRKWEGMLKAMKERITSALPAAITADRFAAVMLNEMRKTPKLYDCSELSLLGAMFTAASLGLTFGTKECWLVPYGQNVQFQVGYIGLVRMIRRTGLVRSVYAKPVYANDKFKFSYGAGATLHHIPADRPEGRPTHYYAFIEFINGGHEWDVWTYDRICAHRDQYSKGAKRTDSPWHTAFDEMAKKTVLLALGKTQDLSFDISRAVAVDGLSGRDLASNVPADAMTPEMEEDFAETIEAEDVQSSISADAKAASKAQESAMKASK